MSRVVDLADIVQEGMIEEVHGAWPACPVHGHPLETAVDDGRALWCCPREGAFRAQIGRLAEALT
jgi:hypothetical protein